MIVFVSTLVVHMAVSLAVGANGWDDGAITLAFSKTFSENGIIALTPSSPEVEGFSSPFWFILVAAINWIHALGFDAIITAGQLLACAFAALSAVILFRILRSVDGRPLVAAAVSVAVISVGPFLQESFNGMEMNALTAAALYMFYCISGGKLAAAAIFAALFPFIRLEAAVYVAVAALVMLLMQEKHRRTGVYLLVGVVLGVCLITALRISVFESFLPNTILAKRWPPYSPDGFVGFARMRFKVAVELACILLVPGIFFALGLLSYEGNLAHRLRAAVKGFKTSTLGDPAFAFGALYVIGVGLTNIAIGKNWGYYGRMEGSAIPIAVIIVGCMFNGFPWIRQKGRSASVNVAILAAVLLIGIIQSDFYTPGLGSTATQPAPGSPAYFRLRAEIYERIRVVLGQSTLSVLTPDMGGTSLCCRQLKILDLALLANPELANEGYSGIDKYIANNLPDVIETHSPWSEASGIEHASSFVTHYKRVTIEGLPLHVRSDVFERIQYPTPPPR
jgi:hypothetical protein